MSVTIKNSGNHKQALLNEIFQKKVFIDKRWSAIGLEAIVWVMCQSYGQEQNWNWDV